MHAHVNDNYFTLLKRLYTSVVSMQGLIRPSRGDSAYLSWLLLSAVHGFKDTVEQGIAPWSSRLAYKSALSSHLLIQLEKNLAIHQKQWLAEEALARGPSQHAVVRIGRRSQWTKYWRKLERRQVPRKNAGSNGGCSRIRCSFPDSRAPSH